MQYVRGEGFDALAELEALDDPGMPFGHALAYVSLLGNLQIMENGGFRAARDAWRRTGRDEIWIFTDGPIRCAIRVPGDGRTQVWHMTLLATAFKGNPDPGEGMDDFVARAGQRVRHGEVMEWA